MNDFFSLNGRIGRAAYIWRTAGLTVATCVIAFGLGMMMGFSGAGEGAASTAGFLIGTVAAIIVAFQAVKRLHDLGRPGSHYWLFFIPIYNIYMGFVLLFQQGTDGTNSYGPNPTA